MLVCGCVIWNRCWCVWLCDMELMLVCGCVILNYVGVWLCDMELMLVCGCVIWNRCWYVAV